MENYRLTFEFIRNFHIGSGYGLARIIDNTVVKNKEDIPYIPASTIKGKLRAAAKRIALSDVRLKDTICQQGDEKQICKETKLEDNCIICRSLLLSG